MANIFKRKLSQDIGITAEAVGSYTVASQTTVVVVGLTVCNTTGSAVNASVYIVDSTESETYLIKDAPIPGGGSLVAVGGDQKVILETGDSIKVISDAETSLDVTMSIMEIS
jgi:hypothetical protein